MKTTFSLLFYLKKPKNYEKGIVPIYLRITVNGKRAETTSGRECDPSLDIPDALTSPFRALLSIELYRP
jgi:hypothetical protein